MHPPPADRHAEARRRATLETLAFVRGEVEQQRPADHALNTFLRRHPHFGSRDRRMLSEAVFAWFRWLGWTAQLADAGDGPRLDAAIWLEHQAHPEGSAEPDPAAFGLVTPLADLARGFAERFALPAPPTPAALVPAFVSAHLDLDDRLVSAWQRRPLTWLRLCGSAGGALMGRIHEAGIPVIEHPRLPGARGVPPGGRLKELLQAHPGAAEVQNLASQAVGRVCAPRAGEFWWDACCGSGGKSLHLLDLAGGRLDLLATDQRPSIVQALQRRLGRRRLRAEALDAAQAGPAERSCDGVLVDAPCSGLGTWSRNSDARWRLEAAEIARLAANQAALLANAARRVKPGGRLVYSVCTLTRDEGPAAVRAFLDSHPEFQPEPFEHPLAGGTGPGELLLRPDAAGGDGMFIANLRRRAG